MKFHVTLNLELINNYQPIILLPQLRINYYQLAYYHYNSVIVEWKTCRCSQEHVECIDQCKAKGDMFGKIKLAVFLFLLTTDVIQSTRAENQCQHDEKCGDKSMLSTKQVCYCGDSHQGFSLKYSELHCCVPPTNLRNSSYTECYLDDFANVHCPYGRKMNKTDQCYGMCYSEYQGLIARNKSLGARAQYKCGNQCVEVQNMCQGYSRCADGSDMQTCNQNFNCSKGLGSWQKNNLETDLVHGHTYCTYNDDDNNRLYDSISSSIRPLDPYCHESSWL